MEPLVIVAIVIAVAVVGWLAFQAQRTQRLRSRYAGEYDRTVGELGRRRGEAELVERQARVRQLNLRPLSSTEHDRFVADWRIVQEQFVDDPEGAVMRGDQLVDEVMRARGYPVADFDRQVADLSVDHPRVVQNYRVARDIALRQRRGAASTEDLRQAMVLYRELFEDLLVSAPSSSGRPSLEREVVQPVQRADEIDVPRTQRRLRDIDREARP
jgi:hypothetical protein